MTSGYAGLESRRLRIAELFLVLVAAFGPSIVSSISALVSPDMDGTVSTSVWDDVLRQFTGLFLLVYVLHRQGRGLHAIGLNFKFSDIPISLVLAFAGYLTYWALLNGLSFSYYKLIGFAETPWHGGASVLGPTFSWAVVILIFINPIFEELIVRGFLMTEVKALTGSAFLACLASILLQGIYHLYQGWMNATALMGLSLVVSLYFARSRRILPVILCHFYFDSMALWVVLKGYY